MALDDLIPGKLYRATSTFFVSSGPPTLNRKYKQLKIHRNKVFMFVGIDQKIGHFDILCDGEVWKALPGVRVGIELAEKP